MCLAVRHISCVILGGLGRWADSCTCHRGDGWGIGIHRTPGRGHAGCIPGMEGRERKWAELAVRLCSCQVSVYI